MPVSYSHHRTAIGLFQNQSIVCNNCYKDSYLGVILECLLALMICGIIRMGIGLISACFQLTVVGIVIDNQNFSVPVIYDMYSFLMFTVYTVCSLKASLSIALPCQQTLQCIIVHLQLVNLLLICSMPVLFDYRRLYILRSGDIELHPGPVAKTKSLSVCHVNIRSLSRSKLLAIQSSLCNTYDIITLSETHLHAGVCNDVFQLKGFQDIVRRDRDGAGGGVAIYVRENIAYKRLYEFEHPGIEAIWICVHTVQGKILVCSCYRPPNNGEFWQIFDTILDDIKLSDEYRYLYVLGDLNADLGTNNGKKMLQICNEQNLQYLISEPTRITPTTQTILDQILTNAHNYVLSTTVSPPISTNDHCTVGVNINFKVQNTEPFYRHIWLFKQADFARFRQALLDTDFDTVFDDDNVDKICDSWSKKFISVAKSNIPNKNVLVRPNDSPWYTSRLRLMKRKLLRIYRKFKKNTTDNNWENYRQARNEYQYALDVAENHYKSSLTNSLSGNKNSKSWWRTVKNILGKGSFRSYPPMKYNNSWITDCKEKADTFNHLFLSNCDVDTSSATLPDCSSIDEIPTLESITATEQEVLDLLLSLDVSKATGPDGIGPKLLREAGYAIVPSLTRLFNICLNSSKFPQMWKHANVLPLHKKDAASDFGNYRPVSLLSVSSKIFEKIVFKNLFNFLRENNIISPHQSGFQPGDSTTNQLAYLYHVFCQALDSKKDMRIVFCDISKAFDRVWHRGLLFKLSKIGVKGKLLDFFKDYLTNRYQRVVIQGQCSEPGLIKAGVPQGSVLGPLLFLIYINDLVDGIASNIKLFADDTTIYMEVNDPNQTAHILNHDLTTLKAWADQWLVTFNATKTKLMTCSFRKIKHPPLIFDNVTLEETSSHKHLGLTLTSNLSWASHITNILHSVSPMVDVLKKLKYQLDKDSLEKIYFSFIRPKLEYGNYIWDNCNATDARLLEDVQLNVAKIVTGARKGTSHDLLNLELNWPTLADRRKGKKLKEFIKIISNNSPNYLQKLIPPRMSVNRPHSRQAENFELLQTRTNTFHKSFIPSAIQLYNSLAISDRTLGFAQSFMENVHLPLLYHGNRSSNVKHAQLRMKCSRLNYHLYLLHVRASFTCPCGHNREDSEHYLLSCPLFHACRVTMLQNIKNIYNSKITCDILLYGAKDLDFGGNCKIFDFVHSYIEETGRL